MSLLNLINKQPKEKTWYDELSPQLRTYLKNQPIYHEKDLWKAGTMGLVVGIIIGAIITWHY